MGFLRPNDRCKKSTVYCRATVSDVCDDADENDAVQQLQLHRDRNSKTDVAVTYSH